MALWYTKSVDSSLLSNESTKTTETHVQILVFVFFLNNLQYAMEVLACEAPDARPEMRLALRRLWKYRLIVKRWLGMLTDPAIYTTASV